MTTSIYNPYTNILSGKGCVYIQPRFTNFLIKSFEKHGTRYDYTNSIYSRRDKKIEIICSVSGHGSFWQLPSNHTKGQGCPKCGLLSRTNKRRLKQKDFITRSNIIHRNKYNYSKVVCKNIYTHVKIKCNIDDHGYFKQTPDHHLQGQGCPICGNEKSGVWKVTEDTPTKDLSWYRYILNLSNETESFYKFGITNNINRRIKEISKTYDVEIVDLYYGSHIDCYKLEQKLKRNMKHRGMKYTPNNDFGGKSECFN